MTTLTFLRHTNISPPPPPPPPTRRCAHDDIEHDPHGTTGGGGVWGGRTHIDRSTQESTESTKWGFFRAEAAAPGRQDWRTLQVFAATRCIGINREFRLIRNLG